MAPTALVLLARSHYASRVPFSRTPTPPFFPVPYTFGRAVRRVVVVAGFREHAQLVRDPDDFALHLDTS